MRLRDLNRNGMLEWDEFNAQLDSELHRFRYASSHMPSTRSRGLRVCTSAPKACVFVCVHRLTHRHSNRFWKLAPLADVPLDMERLTNGEHFMAKVVVAGAVSGVMAKTSASPLARLTILLQTGGIKGASKVPLLGIEWSQR